MRASFDIMRTCGSCVYHAGQDSVQAHSDQGSSKMQLYAMGKPDLRSQTGMPHTSLRYSLAVNVNLERSLSFLICTMGMRTLPSGRLRALTARKHVGYPQQGQAGQEHCYCLHCSCLPRQILWKDLPSPSQKGTPPL